MNATTSGEPQIGRRRFIDILLGTGLFVWLGSLIYPVFKYLIPPKVAVTYVNSIEAGTLKEFPFSSSKIIRFGRKPVIIVRQKDGNFSAMSATCTHLDCIVQYKSDTEQIWCACHNGLYDLQGKNISGPPPKPLTKYPVVVKEDKIIITTEELS
ncbi:MAG: ubiquinol-cytochrome c reductase iron-sulfur subunit [Fidelibacterota bacterium]